MFGSAAARRYDPSESASLMVFRDGWWYLDPDGEVRGAVVLDNLVHHGDLPVTIGVFVDPGVFEDADDRKNRNAEYFAFDDPLRQASPDPDRPPGGDALRDRRGP